MAQHSRASTGPADSNGTDTENARPVRTRRSHTKSRNGCTECKNRHIRCDERQPSCANCEIAERTCFFPQLKVDRKTQRQGQQSRAKQKQQLEATAAISPGAGVGNYSDASSLDANPHRPPSLALPLQLGNTSIPLVNCVPGLSNVPDTAPKAIFTPQHMILLRHADRVPSFTAPNRSAVDIAIRHAVGSPYLLDEILAFTAFHLAHLYPGSSVQLQHTATELQTRALASFTLLTEAVPNNDKATAVPRFLFSAILGRHVLADTLAHYRSDFHLFIDRFVECFNLNRGIRSVTPPARDFLYDSEIQPFLKVILDAESRITSPGHECEPLEHLIDGSDLSDVSAKACRQAIEVLQRSFDIFHGLDEHDYPEATSVFSVGVEVGFVEVLRKHRPEALIILAYYGVLLHWCHSFWAFGDAGASMIRAIAGHVGSYWQEPLAWPLHVLEMERIEGPVDTRTISSHAPT